MKPDCHILARERNNCHVDKQNGGNDKQTVSVASSCAEDGRGKDFYDFLKDRVG
jgi:hypothetical protein